MRSMQAVAFASHCRAVTSSTGLTLDAGGGQDGFGEVLLSMDTAEEVTPHPTWRTRPVSKSLECYPAGAAVAGTLTTRGFQGSSTPTTRESGASVAR